MRLTNKGLQGWKRVKRTSFWAGVLADFAKKAANKHSKNRQSWRKCSRKESVPDGSKIYRSSLICLFFFITKGCSAEGGDPSPQRFLGDLRTWQESSTCSTTGRAGEAKVGKKHGLDMTCVSRACLSYCLEAKYLIFEGPKAKKAGQFRLQVCVLIHRKWQAGANHSCDKKRRHLFFFLVIVFCGTYKF